jgi:poly [ADP-ribose] polymerase
MGQSKLLGSGSLPDAMANFNAKFKDKSGLTWAQRNDPPKPKKYTFIEKSYEDDSDDEAEDDVKEEEEEDGEKWVPPESKLEQPIQELMALIFNTTYMNNAMADLNYDAKKMPLGKLAKGTILKGFQTLKDLAALFDDNSLAQSVHGTAYRAAVEMLSNRFYSYIPHDFGRNRPPVIDNEPMLKREIELLESLGDMKEAAAIMKQERPKDTVHVYDRQFGSLGMEEMTVLDKESTEFKELAAYLVDSKGATHNVNYKVEEIFRIERAGEKKRFDESVYPTIPSDRRLLWHGSRATNFGGILSQGLRIAPPEAPVSGYMVGLLVVVTDSSSARAFTSRTCRPSRSTTAALTSLIEPRSSSSARPSSATRSRSSRTRRTTLATRPRPAACTRRGARARSAHPSGSARARPTSRSRASRW